MQRHGCGLVVHPGTQTTSGFRVSLLWNPLCERGKITEQIWRWYGPNDPAPLADVRQTGATDVVTALHHIPNGEVWSVEEALKRKTVVKDASLVRFVVEDVPIREDIKTHTGNYKQWIINYQQTLRNLAQRDVRTVYYNFMSVPDWTRIDLEYALPDGPKALRFDQIELVASEMYILKRPGVETDYTEEEIAQAAERFTIVSDEDRTRLTHSIIAGLPGTEERYTLDQLRKHLELYKDINKVKLRENSAVFLEAVIPVTGEVSVRMAVHPDDPSHPILGLPHIVSAIEDIRWMVDTVNSTANGFIMCTGSYDVRADNDLVDTIKQLGPRTYFTHLHSTIREDNPKILHEAAHLNGDVDMYEVVEVIVEEEHRRKAEGREDLVPVYPDHDHRMLDDLKEKTNPGYSAIGRPRGPVEVRDVESAIQRAFFSR